LNILKHETQIDESEMRFLLTGSIGVENSYTNPTTWLPTKPWDEICILDRLQNFSSIRKSFFDNKDIWQAFYESEVCYLRVCNSDSTSFLLISFRHHILKEYQIFGKISLTIFKNYS
jgi:hypothetical protein